MAKWLSLTGKQIADAQAATTNALQVPDNAKRNKKDANDAFWHERVRVNKAGSTTASNTDGHEVTKVEIQWAITEAGGSGRNPGRGFTDYLAINWHFYPDGDKNAGWYGASQRNFGKIQAILRNSGINPDLPDGGYSEALLASSFPDDGTQTPLLNKEFDVEIRQKIDDYTGDLRPQVNRIQPSTKAKASTKPAGVVSV